MKKLITMVVVLSFAVAIPVFAQQRDLKAPNARAYEKADERSALNRVGDWFATVGKSPEEKQMIIAERGAKRAAAKLQKQAKKQSGKMSKQADKAAKGMGNAFKMPKK
jgi:hypothetical protein